MKKTPSRYYQQSTNRPSSPEQPQTNYILPAPTNLNYDKPPSDQDTSYISAKPETSYNAPKPETSYVVPKPETSYNAPKPETSYNAPKPETSYNAPKTHYDPATVVFQYRYNESSTNEPQKAPVIYIIQVHTK